MNFKDLKAGDVLIVNRIDTITLKRPTIATIIKRMEHGEHSGMTYYCEQQTKNGHGHYITENDVIEYLPKENYPEYYL